MVLVTGSWLLDAALLLAPLLYWYMTRNFGFWKKLGVPYMKPKPFVGNMGGVVMRRQHMGDPVLDCYRAAGDAPFMGMFAFDSPLLMVKDVQLVGRILSTDFSTFYSTNAKVDPHTAPLVAMSLFGQHGPQWKSLRTILSPAFTSGKMKLMFKLVNDIGHSLIHHIDAASSKGEAIELKEAMACYTTDAVSSVFMGVEAGSLQDKHSPVRAHLRKLLRDDFVGTILTTMLFFAPKLLSILKIRVGSKKAEEYFMHNTEKLMEQRKRSGIVRNDLIDMLSKIKDGQLSDGEDSAEEQSQEKEKATDNQFKLTNEAIAGQLLSFLGAGFDTSSSVMSFALFELSRNLELQDKLRRHVRQVLAKHGGQVTYEAISEMTELTNAVNETLRMYPPVNFHDREAMRDYPIPGSDVVLPKGTGVVISVTGLHYDPRYWQEPHRFIPDRFKEENSRDRPSYTFLPFGEGPRMCIGLRLGYLQVKVGLAHILNNFEVVTVPETPSSLKMDPTKFLGVPNTNVPVAFKRISAA